MYMGAKFLLGTGRNSINIVTNCADAKNYSHYSYWYCIQTHEFGVKRPLYTVSLILHFVEFNASEQRQYRSSSKGTTFWEGDF